MQFLDSPIKTSNRIASTGYEDLVKVVQNHYLWINALSVYNLNVAVSLHTNTDSL